jgi:hypothetical protein
MIKKELAFEFAPLNAAADGDDGNRVFTGSQQSTSGMFTRPFAPNKNHEFLPILLFLNHQIDFSKFILEVGLCKHKHSQSSSQDGFQNSQAPSHIANCQALSSHLRIFFEVHNEAGIRTHANCKHQKQPFIIARSLQTSQASHHHKILCKPAKPVIISRSSQNSYTSTSKGDFEIDLHGLTNFKKHKCTYDNIKSLI